MYIGRVGNRRIRFSITFGVITNYFGQLIRNIIGLLRIAFGRLQIAFADGLAKTFFSSAPFLDKFYAKRSNSMNKLRITVTQF